MTPHDLWNRLEAVEHRIDDVKVLVGLGELRGHLAGAYRVAHATPAWLRWLHRHTLRAVHETITDRLDELDQHLRRRGR